MLEDQVAYLLQRYLGNYVRGLNKEALKISVWKGSEIPKFSSYLSVLFLITFNYYLNGFTLPIFHFTAELCLNYSDLNLVFN